MKYQRVFICGQDGRNFGQQYTIFYKHNKVKRLVLLCQSDSFKLFCDFECDHSWNVRLRHWDLSKQLNSYFVTVVCFSLYSHYFIHLLKYTIIILMVKFIRHCFSSTKTLRDICIGLIQSSWVPCSLNLQQKPYVSDSLSFFIIR